MRRPSGCFIILWLPFCRTMTKPNVSRLNRSQVQRPAPDKASRFSEIDIFLDVKVEFDGFPNSYHQFIETFSLGMATRKSRGRSNTKILPHWSGSVLENSSPWEEGTIGVQTKDDGDSPISVRIPTGMDSATIPTSLQMGMWTTTP